MSNTQRYPGNYLPDAIPGCHVVHDPSIPSWCLEKQSELFDPLEFGLDATNEHMMPEISIEPESGIVCLTNRSHGKRRSFFLTFGHQLLGRNDVPLSTGVWRDEHGTTHPCTTLVVVLQPRRLLEVCRVVPERLDPHISVWEATKYGDTNTKESVAEETKTTEHFNQVDLYSTVSDVELGINTDTTNTAAATSLLDLATASSHTTVPPLLPFPLGGKGPFMCSQGPCGCFTHFYVGTMHAVDLSCPVGTPVLAVGDGVIVNVKDTTTVGGIHSAHLFQWNSIMLKINGDTINADEKEMTLLQQNFTAQQQQEEETAEDGEQEKKTTSSRLPIYVEYVHIASGSAAVKKGDVVKQGDVLCTSGDVGFCPTPHLHIQVHRSLMDNAPTVPFLLRSANRAESEEVAEDDVVVAYVPRAGVMYSRIKGPV